MLTVLLVFILGVVFGIIVAPIAKRAKIKKQYRIVRDSWLGYECQVKYPLWPFWHQCKFSNIHPTVADAKKWIEEGCPSRDKPEIVSIFDANPN